MNDEAPNSPILIEKAKIAATRSAGRISDSSIERHTINGEAPSNVAASFKLLGICLILGKMQRTTKGSATKA